MSQWSNPARSRLEDYLLKVRPALAASGADAEQVVEDLRRHLEEEIHRQQLPIVTEQDVDRMLADIGAPPPPAATFSTPPSTAAGPKPEPQPHSQILPGAVNRPA